MPPRKPPLASPAASGLWFSSDDKRAWNHSNEVVSLQTQTNSTRRSRVGGFGPLRKCQMFLRIHAHGVDLAIQLRLRHTGTNSVAECLGEVANLADMNGDVRVVGARGDGERMPLIFGHGRHLQEEPLAGLVPEGGLGELNLNDIFTHGKRHSGKRKAACSPYGCRTTRVIFVPLRARTSRYKRSIK